MGAFQVTSSIQTKGFVMSRQPHGSHCLENAMGFSSVSEIGTKTKYVFLVINHSITTGVYAFLSQQHFAHNGYSINMSAWKEWVCGLGKNKTNHGAVPSGPAPMLASSFGQPVSRGPALCQACPTPSDRAQNRTDTDAALTGLSTEGPPYKLVD